MEENVLSVDDRAGTQLSFPDLCGRTAQTIAAEMSQMEGGCPRLY
jgi:hypothetical protein